MYIRQFIQAENLTSASQSDIVKLTHHHIRQIEGDIFQFTFMIPLSGILAHKPIPKLGTDIVDRDIMNTRFQPVHSHLDLGCALLKGGLHIEKILNGHQAVPDLIHKNFQLF